ncbi:MAG TPA: hypothetical protein VF268_07740 [Gammaproteobacteria bacterium]
MANTALSPPGLPRDAVLISKKISCSIKQSATGSGRQISRSDWQGQVDRALALSGQQAVRYLNGICTANGAGSVIFENVPESLACFLCDIVRGTVHDEWWWKSYLRKYPVGADKFKTIAVVLHDNLIVLPQIVHYLARWKMITEVFRAVSENACLELLNGFQTCFRLNPGRYKQTLNALVSLLLNVDKKDGLDEGAGSSVENYRANPAGSAENLNAGLGRENGLRRSIPLNRSKHDGFCEMPVADIAHSVFGSKEQEFAEFIRVFLPVVGYVDYKSFFDRSWRKYIGDVTASANLSFAQRNLVGLAYLANNIHAVRNDEFQRMLCMLLHPVVQSEFHEIRRLISEDAAFTSSMYDAAMTSGGLNGASVLPAASTASRQNTLDGDGVKDNKSSSTGAVKAGGAHIDRSGKRELADPAGPDAEAGSFFDPASMSQEWQWTTDYGGVLYLINLLQFLDIPGVFENSNSIRNTLSLWGWLEILGRYLLGSEKTAGDDDLWKALALLDGRKISAAPGEDFQYMGEFEIPQSWLDGLTPDERKNMTSAESVASVHARLDKVISNTSLLVFLEILLPAIQARLFRAIGETNEALLIEVLRCRGRISVTRTHVDFYTSLDHISLIARRAGLDRDPGWCPEAGRVVQFHYE